MVTASWPPAEADGDVEGFDPYVDQLSILADVPPGSPGWGSGGTGAPLRLTASLPMSYGDPFPSRRVAGWVRSSQVRSWQT